MGKLMVLAIVFQNFWVLLKVTPTVQSRDIEGGQNSSRAV